jgi:aspartate kinase
MLDAKDLIRFKGHELDYRRTNQNIKSTIAQKRRIVIPGFYGADADGQIKVMDRGGSDITGAVVARAMEVEVYENWTDVDGFLTADPKIVTKPKLIESMTYKELRVLSFMGASVLHHETFYPAAKARIPIHIRNTFNLQSSGTWIYNNIPHEQNQSFLTGISGVKNYTLVVIEKEMMSEIVGLDRKILSITEKLDINVEHFPSGTDTFSMMIESKYLANGKKENLLNQIKKSIKPHLLEVSENISLISLIGRNLLAQNNHILKLFTALINDNIAVKMIDFGSSGVNIVIGVNDEDYAFAIRAMYKAFIDQGIVS